MDSYVLFVFTMFLAATLDSVASDSKRYRGDYVYNDRTDAFYKLHIESRYPWKINGVCEVEGATLMVPATHEDIIQVHGLFKQYRDLGRFVWVATDGRKHESEEEEQAIINLSVEEDTGSFKHTDTCVVVTREGAVEDMPCFRQLPFVCKVEAKDAPYDSHCDVYAHDYQYNATTGSCYSIRRWVASWNEAYSECRSEGAHLVVLNSEAEMVAVRKLMQSTPRVKGAQNPWYYFAGFRANKPVGDETAVFKTIFNETLSDAGYTGWSPGEPNNWNGEYCGTLLSSDGKLNDANCDHLYAFICEKEQAGKAS